MKPWEFIIESKEDLPIFADLLADWNHPGEEAVRWLVKEGKWMHHHDAWASGSHPPGVAGWGWYATYGIQKEGTVGDSEIKSVFASEGHSYWIVYHNPTEAVWGFINAWVGKKSRKG